jgi:hypothetical protein
LVVAAALLALIAVLLAEDTGTPLFVAGGKAFVKGVEMLDEQCGGLRYTQHTLRHLEADIQRVQASEPKFAGLWSLCILFATKPRWSSCFVFAAPARRAPVRFPPHAFFCIFYRRLHFSFHGVQSKSIGL